MKLALVFLLVFVTISNQQQYQKKYYWAPVNHQQDQPSRFQHYQHPFAATNDHNIEPSMVISASDFPEPWVDQRYYQRKKPQYLNNEASPNISPIFWYTDPGMISRQGLLFRNYHNAFNSHSFEEDEEPIKSRRPYPSNVVDPAQERLFGLLSGSFGGSPIVTNTSTARPFFGAFITKTFVSVTTVLLNSTTTPLCIASAAVNSVACKRRRRGMKIPHDFNLPDDMASQISPSLTEKNEMTAGISSDGEDSFAFYKDKNTQLNQFLLQSSKEDVFIVGSDDKKDEVMGERDKRQFIVSTTTTLTSYSISPVVAPTKTISIDTMSTTLVCLPPGLKTC